LFIVGVTAGISIPFMWVALNLESLKKIFPWNSKLFATSSKTAATAGSGLPRGRKRVSKSRGLKPSPKLEAGKPKATEGRTGSVDLPEDETRNDIIVAGESDTKSEQRGRLGFWVRKRAGASEPSSLENAESGKLAASNDGTGSRRDLEKGE
jgi:hypothetical protein